MLKWDTLLLPFFLLLHHAEVAVVLGWPLLVDDATVNNIE